ncbi:MULTISPECIES: GntR family transcriptional regulator [Methylobacterium]|uniref:HTH-type transcriptional repressor RspR n=1 Tax=Methylobacterium thuringiense TaxID=1003091 RepID=A0ABQ4TLR5_9HYPH|nr:MULTISPECIES: GntR family transcriptional regulator [Methylobacterium]TXN20358.1 GntR family transcriptional regulator [Methylobacterium sp. WL9]GJE56236.1 HTH-type transcriptional repressor RspR [Methylobacterium thuringiense]
MNKIEPGIGINRRYLHDEVADRMRELIHVGELEPKARVNESELTERFGISRTPLREAIKILATEGLLELLPNRGARVASISQSEIEEMIEVIAGLEATACDLACRTITDDEIAAIEQKHAGMVAAWKERDEAVYFRLNREIHEAIMNASRNSTLQGIYAGLSGRTQRSRYLAHQTDEQWARAVEEHEGMIPLLQARDGERLAKLMREHIRAKKPVIAATYGEPAAGAAEVA